MQRPVGVTIPSTFSLIWGILVSPNRVFDASLVPETCLDRFVDLKGLIKQVSEERVWDYLGKQSSPGINFLGWGLGSYLSAAFLILMVICFGVVCCTGLGIVEVKKLGAPHINCPGSDECAGCSFASAIRILAPQCGADFLFRHQGCNRHLDSHLLPPA
jgi:hypothetical protein